MPLETLIQKQLDGENVIIKRKVGFLRFLFSFKWYQDWKCPNSEIHEVHQRANFHAEKLFACLQELENRESAKKALIKEIKDKTKGKARLIMDPEPYVIQDKKDFRFKPLNYVAQPELLWKDVVKPELFNGKDALGIAAKWRTLRGGSGPSGTATRIVPSVETFRQKTSTNHNVYGGDGIDDVIEYRPNDGGNNGNKGRGKGNEPWRKRRSGESNQDYGERMKRINTGNAYDDDFIVDNN